MAKKTAECNTAQENTVILPFVILFFEALVRKTFGLAHLGTRDVTWVPNLSLGVIEVVAKQRKISASIITLEIQQTRFSNFHLLNFILCHP